MNIKVVLFDLDGTLLPMDQDLFVKAYFGGLAKFLAPLGYESEKLISAIWKGTKSMVLNNGTTTNEKAFWNTFCQIYSESAINDEPYFDKFYKTEFKKVKEVLGYTPQAKKVIDLAVSKGLRIALATNPIFPKIATESRIEWAGLKPNDFELYTTYENSSYCKPNPNYYKEIFKKLGVQPEECLMVGNDVSEDMVAKSLGCKVFLLTDCILNKNNEDISVYPNGNFNDLIKFIDCLL